MATKSNSTTAATLVDPALPLAHRANTDAPGHWEARVAALEALRDRFIAQGAAAAVAADKAILQLDAELEAEAAAVAARKLEAARERARAKAEYHLAGGLEVRRVGTAVLVPSGSRGGVIHRVEGGQCSCEAGRAGRHCWHVEAAALAPEPATFRAQRVGQLIAAARARQLARVA